MKHLPLFLFLLLALGLLLGAASCAQVQRRRAKRPMLEAYQTDKFRLSAGPCAVDDYPATIDEGRFLNSSGGGFPVPWGHFLTGNWTGSGTGWAVGDEWQAVPDSLEIRWFSYTEDKFWEGHFLLPQRQLHAWLKEGFWDTDAQRPATYDGLTVCVAPTGVVYVWLDSGENKVLVGRYQAQEIQYDYARHRPRVNRAADVAQTRGELPAAVQAEIKAGAVSTAKWDAYLKRYPWKLELTHPATLTTYAVRFVNAEFVGAPRTRDVAAYVQEILTPASRALPKSCMLYLAAPYGRKRLVKVSPFDEAETRAAFQTLRAKYPDEPVTLHVETDEALRTAVLSWRAGALVIPLVQTRTELFDLR